MTNNNNYEKKNFRALIESDGIGRVDDRLNIIDAFLDTEDHVTLEEFISLLRERGFEYDSDFGLIRVSPKRRPLKGNHRDMSTDISASITTI